MMLKIWTATKDYHEFDLRDYTLVLDDHWVAVAHPLQGISVFPWTNIVRLWHPDPKVLKEAAG